MWSRSRCQKSGKGWASGPNRLSWKGPVSERERKSCHCCLDSWLTGWRSTSAWSRRNGQVLSRGVGCEVERQHHGRLHLIRRCGDLLGKVKRHNHDSQRGGDDFGSGPGRTSAEAETRMRSFSVSSSVLCIQHLRGQEQKAWQAFLAGTTEEGAIVRWAGWAIIHGSQGVGGGWVLDCNYHGLERGVVNRGLS